MKEPTLMMPDHRDRRVPGVFPTMLWHFVRSVMWFWAIVGPLCVVLAVISYFVEVRDPLFLLFGGTVAWGGALGGVGVSFVWLQMRGYIRFVGED
jgi:hypothetical protein